jgi:excisionase family DNA binding protein
MRRTLSTAEFAKALGVSDSSARRMADSGEIEIRRTRGGHRRIPISEALRFVRETRTPVVHPELLGLEVAPATVRAGPAEAQMLAALEAGRAGPVIGLTQLLYAGGMPVHAICDGPIRYAMESFGNRWPHDRRAIFLEHRATILCVRALNELRMSMPEPDAEAPEAMGAAMQGDMYLLPTLMSSLVLHELGFHETNLGPNTPLDVLIDAIEDEQPRVVWLCIAEPLRSRALLRELHKLACAAQQQGSRLFLGGRHAADIPAPRDTGWTYCRTMGEFATACAPLVHRSHR